jgi:2-polyprenyl-6-hydroxyphenyl methylase / 3-demethylubiquinone-9 3-methyltransferase
VSSADYVRDYFDRHAHAWLEEAYAEGDTPAAFPLGKERLRLALSGVADAGKRLVDLGCGGGQLCAVAAELGLSVTGVDVAPGMIEEAEALRATLPPEQAERISLEVSSLDEFAPAEGSFDAATAMGLIEYLPDDAALFEPTRRLLRPGGLLAVSCRNRLYNLQSANDYTAGEIGAGDAPGLLSEMRARLEDVRPEDLRALGRELAARASLLHDAAALDESEPPPDYLGHVTAFRAERRQHTPAEIDKSARDAGFEPVSIRALHPHPLPPGLEKLAPRVYNQLVLAWQRTLADSAAGLFTASAFVAVYAAPQ